MRIVGGLLALALMTAIAHAQSGPLPAAIQDAGVTQAQWDEIRAEVRRQAQRAGVAEAALLAAAERAGVNLSRSGRFNAQSLRDAIITQLQDQARSIADLQARLTVLAQADDPDIAHFLREAQTAVDEGRLDDADALLAQAEQSDLAAIAVVEARAERARARIADAIIERGRLDRTRASGSSSGVREAIARYRETLSGIDRELAPRDWARVQFNLGVAYAIAAQDGDDLARDPAIAALGSAASTFNETQDAEQAVRAQLLVAALEAR